MKSELHNFIKETENLPLTLHYYDTLETLSSVKKNLIPTEATLHACHLCTTLYFMVK